MLLRLGFVCHIITSLIKQIKARYISELGGFHINDDTDHSVKEGSQ